MGQLFEGKQYPDMVENIAPTLKILLLSVFLLSPEKVRNMRFAFVYFLVFPGVMYYAQVYKSAYVGLCILAIIFTLHLALTKPSIPKA